GPRLLLPQGAGPRTPAGPPALPRGLYADPLHWPSHDPAIGQCRRAGRHGRTRGGPVSMHLGYEDWTVARPDATPRPPGNTSRAMIRATPGRPTSKGRSGRGAWSGPSARRGWVSPWPSKRARRPVSVLSRTDPKVPERFPPSRGDKTRARSRPDSGQPRPW